jgi:hypothetical protein
VRRLAFAVLLFGLVLAPAADATPPPASLQADLLIKLAPYDKNLPARAGDRVLVFLVTRAGDDDSARWSLQMRAALAQTTHIAGLPHVEVTVPYGGADELAARVRSERAALVVIPTTLGGEVDAMRRAFDGANVLTIAPEAELVRRGMVLGYEVISGKPKLFFNLPQARRQGVAMSADVLKLMTVIQ